MTRRTALRALGVVGASAVGVDAFVIEPAWLELGEHELRVPHLPASAEGALVAQITDPHLESLRDVEWLAAALAQREPQLVVLSGDLVDSTKKLPLVEALCDALSKSGRELVACLGNWEHWGGVNLIQLDRAYRRSGAKLLVNETVSLASGISVFATDDGLAGSPRYERISEQRGPLRLLLTHSPALLDELPTLPQQALCLSGHTHGGQLRLGEAFIPYLPPGCGRFVAGPYSTRVGPAYVSRGTGTSVIPARLSCRPELPLFRFLRA